MPQLKDWHPALLRRGKRVTEKMIGKRAKYCPDGVTRVSEIPYGANVDIKSFEFKQGKKLSLVKVMYKQEEFVIMFKDLAFISYLKETRYY